MLLGNVLSRECKVVGGDLTRHNKVQRPSTSKHANYTQTKDYNLFKTCRSSHIVQSSLNKEEPESSLTRSDALEIDQDLYSVLELATDDELEQIYNTLYGTS